MQILVVDDDEMIRKSLEACLVDEGHRVLAADGPDAATDLIEAHPDLELLVTDFNLGKVLDGADVARRFHAAHPGSQVLMISGSPELARARIAGCDFVGLMHKPFQFSELLLAIEARRPP